MRTGLVVAAILLLTAGCSAAGDEHATETPRLTPLTRPPATANPSTTTETPGETALSTTVAPTRPAAGAPLPDVAAWVDAGQPADPAGFHTATRGAAVTQLDQDIAFVTPLAETQCITDMRAGGALACLVDLEDPPAQPADSYGKWIGGWVDFDGTTVRVGSAHGDPGRFALGTGARLDYGHTLRFGDYRCRADPGGLVCINFAHQSGVRLADSGIEPLGCLQPAQEPGTGQKFSC
jgi:hypothetical protein